MKLLPSGASARPVGLLVSCQTGSVAKLLPALGADMVAHSFYAAHLVVFRGLAPPASPAPPATSVLLAEGVKVGLIP